MALTQESGFQADLRSDRPGLPRRLARLGYERGMSQAKMAIALRVTVQTLLNIRRNRRAVTDLADAWAELVGLDLEDSVLSQEMYYELLAVIDARRAEQHNNRDRVLLMDDTIRFLVTWAPGQEIRSKARKTAK